MTQWPSRILHSIVRRYNPDISEAQLRRELRHLRGTLRFVAIFGLTVVIPILVLGWFALSSIQGEEVIAEQEVMRSADAVVGQVYFSAGEQFDRFEDQTAGRLRAGESVLSNLGDLSPHLRVAFRLSAAGDLVAPFKQAEPVTARPPTARYRRLWEEGRARLGKERPDQAAESFRLAAKAGVDPGYIAEARLAEAVAIAQAGDGATSDEMLADLYADHANVRDRYGFRIGDLVLLKRGETALARDPDVGSIALHDLVDELLGGRYWTIGYTSEMSVADRALTAVERHVEAEWVARAHSRLSERTEQLFWAESTLHEVADLVDAAPAAPGVFRYTSRPNSHAVWAVTSWSGEIYAFSFDRSSMRAELDAGVASAASLEPDITAWVAAADSSRPGTLVTRPLQPWLPFDAIITAPTDPEALLTRTRRRRTSRIAVISIIMLTVLVGVAMSARIVSTELENARMKTDFAANVSHELRSPITNIRVQAEALLLDLVFDDEDRHRHHEAIVREAERLSRLVDNVLDFAAIERGAKKYHFRPEDPTELLYRALDATSSGLKGKKVTLDADIPEALPVVWADREAMSQVLTNLLSNAIKYGGDGNWVGVRAHAEEEELVIEVSDKGIGMSAEDAAQVFEHFFRSSDPLVRKQKGTGIGLAIVGYIVEAHRGSISVTSEKSIGTTFTIRLPLTPPDGDHA
ncbi:MAG: HAMP domain-containing histidine kinase [Proteobacteria bacterium]|nr:HAMP domain-containing histidine kinase [Pseudomonadota bacterium]